ncbi:MAG: cytochrome c [Rhodobacteraceae bacterium]|nr:cytochrome c [Paracoccaceae bacterium]
MASKFLIGTVITGLVLAGGFVWLSQPPAGAQVAPVVSGMHGGTDTQPGLNPDDIVLPVLSATAEQGKADFDKGCAVCHGVNAAGTERGPTLIHSLYRPGHHPDGSFYRAALQGVVAHHWRFGNMPPVPGITEAELGPIIVYLRELQQANGVN